MHATGAKINYFKRVRLAINAHPALLVAFVLLLAGAALALNWRAILTYGLRVDEPLPSSFKNLHRGIRGEKDARQTMPATLSPDDRTITYTIRGSREDAVEVGVVRIVDGRSQPSAYVFSVYERVGKIKRKVFEKSGVFPLDSWALYDIGDALEWRDDGTTEIEYELKPDGVKNRIAAIMSSAGGSPYYKDFAFLAPNVLRRRKPSEFNVVLISFDTLRADHLGCFGYPRPTSPNIDGFARQAVLFKNAVSPSPWTIPSHRSVFTGLYPSAHSIRAGDRLNDRFIAEKTMVSLFRDNGYYTLGITGGLCLSHSYGFSAGFKRLIEYESITNAEDPHATWEHEDGTRKGFEFATDWLEANHRSKFFMYLHHYECHDPYEDERFLKEVKGGSLIEKRIALYDGDTRRGDIFFGEFLDKLTSLNLLSNTIIVFYSDHGEEFNDHFTEADRIRGKVSNPIPQISSVDHGHSLHEELTRVPLIFHLPGLEPPNAILENQVRLIDILPTIVDYLDIPYDGPMQGESLLKLIESGKRSYDPPAISEFMLYEPEMKSIRTNQYKYIIAEDPLETGREPTLRRIPPHALYDLINDPGEKNNLYEQETELAMKFHETLKEVLEESRAINQELQAKGGAPKEKSATEQAEIMRSMKALGYLQ